MTLRQEKTWSTDTIVLVFGYLTVLLHLCAITSPLGKLIALDGWCWRREGHSLRPLGSHEEGELCLHAVHMALRMEDGIEGDVLNA